MITTLIRHPFTNKKNRINFQLCVETFREGRFYEDLTHLKFSCTNGWPYKLVPMTVLISLILFSIVIVVAFAVKLVLNQ
jgi:hypothetical protein